MRSGGRFPGSDRNGRLPQSFSRHHGVVLGTPESRRPTRLFLRAIGRLVGILEKGIGIAAVSRSNGNSDADGVGELMPTDGKRGVGRSHDAFGDRKRLFRV